MESDDSPAPALPALVVHEQVMGDREDQGPELPFPALEVDHAGEDPKEDLVGQPVGILGSGAAQVARHRSAQPPEQPLEGPTPSRLRRGQHDGEALSVAAAVQ